MAKIIFCFAGTGSTGERFGQIIEEQNNFNDDVIRVYIKGCQNKNVGGNALFPDLDIVAKKIRGAFNKDQTLDLAKLRRLLGNAITQIEGPTANKSPHISTIGLYGFSRGAVTTFATAKKLNELAIPMHLIANQPVPGQMSEHSFRSLYAKYHDLSACENIKSATTLLSTYSMQNGVIDNTFFQQMVATFPASTETNNYLLPHQSHLEWARHDFAASHISKQLDNKEFATRSAYWGDYDYDINPRVAYRNNDEFYFTPPEFGQKIFGAEKVTIRLDPNYVAVIKSKANEILTENNFLELSTELTVAQARAIVAISKADALKAEVKNRFYSFVLEQTNNAKKFIKIVNKTQDTTEYLIHAVDDKKTTKSALIKHHSNQFKKDIFLASYGYLKSEPFLNKEELCRYISRAEKTFERNALDIDRNIMRRAMKVIVNSILAITGIGMFANYHHKQKTGSWYFFDDTRSTRVMKNALKEINETTNSPDPEAKSFKI